MFAQLGSIQFELITYFSGIQENSSYNYAQHERINQKPILQFLGENLKTIQIKLNFHSSFCTPRNEMETLTAVAETGTPLTFIKGNGEYLGIFVINEIMSSTEQATNEGDVIEITAELRLTEYSGQIITKTATNRGLKMK